MKELVKLYHLDDIITCNKDVLKQNSVYICFSIIFPYFLKFSSILINMQIRLSICISDHPIELTTIFKLHFASTFNSVGWVANEI